MSDDEGTQGERVTTLAVVKDGVVGLAIIATAYALEYVGGRLFPHGLPLLPKIMLAILDLSLLIALLITFVRLLKTLLTAIGMVRSNATIEGQAPLPASVASRALSAIAKAYGSAVGTGLLTGFICGVLALVMIMLAGAPGYVRLSLLGTGLLFVFIGFVAALQETSSARKRVADSGGAGCVVFVLMLAIGLPLLVLAGGAQVEDWSGFLLSLSNMILSFGR